MALLILGSAAESVASGGAASSCPGELPGIWSTELPVADLFNFEITVERSGQRQWQARIRSRDGAEEVVEAWRAADRIRFQSAAARLSFDGLLFDDDSLDGFFAHASRLTHVRMPRTAEGPEARWAAAWAPLGVDAERSLLDLYIGTEAPGVFAGWFFFRDQRLPGLFGYGTRCDGDRLRFAEKNLELELEGWFRRREDRLDLTVSGPGRPIPLVFRRLETDPMTLAAHGDENRAAYTEQAPAALRDGWATATPSAVDLDASRVAALVEEVRLGRLPKTHAVLVARRGQLVVEEYFYGYHHALRHDMRSASKSVASALVGAAIDRGLLRDVDSPVLPYFARYRRLANWDPRKAKITVENLLTMSSGLHSDDYDPEAAASERSYQSQTREPDWARVALDAPMAADPGSVSRYSGSNPLLLGGVLEQAAGEPVELFADRALFAPLGITDYQWSVDPTGRVYLGGGLHLRPRDMAKLGQLYLDGGSWNGRRVLSEAWVERSTARHTRLANVPDKNEYGYLWWRQQYRLGDRQIGSIEARGNGGQYIFVIPDLEMVVVITSGNYRDRELLRQPEQILERYLLPAASGKAEPASVGPAGPSP